MTQDYSSGDIFPLTTIKDARGSLTVIEAEQELPFTIRRVYWLHGVTSDSRGHHAHHACQQIIVAISGAFTLNMDDGRKKWKHRLKRPDEGALIEPIVWHSMSDFLPETVCLVLASHPYDEADYIRDYHEFFNIVKELST